TRMFIGTSRGAGGSHKISVSKPACPRCGMRFKQAMRVLGSGSTRDDNNTTPTRGRGDADKTSAAAAAVLADETGALVKSQSQTRSCEINPLQPDRDGHPEHKRGCENDEGRGRIQATNKHSCQPDEHKRAATDRNNEPRHPESVFDPAFRISRILCFQRFKNTVRRWFLIVDGCEIDHPICGARHTANRFSDLKL